MCWLISKFPIRTKLMPLRMVIETLITIDFLESSPVLFKKNIESCQVLFKVCVSYGPMPLMVVILFSVIWEHSGVIFCKNGVMVFQNWIPWQNISLRLVHHFLSKCYKYFCRHVDDSLLKTFYFFFYRVRTVKWYEQI